MEKAEISETKENSNPEPSNEETPKDIDSESNASNNAAGYQQGLVRRLSTKFDRWTIAQSASDPEERKAAALPGLEKIIQEEENQVPELEKDNKEKKKKKWTWRKKSEKDSKEDKHPEKEKKEKKGSWLISSISRSSRTPEKKKNATETVIHKQEELQNKPVETSTQESTRTLDSMVTREKSKEDTKKENKEDTKKENKEDTKKEKEDKHEEKDKEVTTKENKTNNNVAASDDVIGEKADRVVVAKKADGAVAKKTTTTIIQEENVGNSTQDTKKNVPDETHEKDNREIIGNNESTSKETITKETISGEAATNSENNRSNLADKKEQTIEEKVKRKSQAPKGRERSGTVSSAPFAVRKLAIALRMGGTEEAKAEQQLEQDLEPQPAEQAEESRLEGKSSDVLPPKEEDQKKLPPLEEALAVIATTELEKSSISTSEELSKQHENVAESGAPQSNTNVASVIEEKVLVVPSKIEISESEKAISEEKNKENHVIEGEKGKEHEEKGKKEGKGKKKEEKETKREEKKEEQEKKKEEQEKKKEEQEKKKETQEGGKAKDERDNAEDEKVPIAVQPKKENLVEEPCQTESEEIRNQICENAKEESSGKDAGGDQSREDGSNRITSPELSKEESTKVSSPEMSSENFEPEKEHKSDDPENRTGHAKAAKKQNRISKMLKTSVFKFGKKKEEKEEEGEKKQKPAQNSEEEEEKVESAEKITKEVEKQKKRESTKQKRSSRKSRRHTISGIPAEGKTSKKEEDAKRFVPPKMSRKQSKRQVEEPAEKIEQEEDRMFDAAKQEVDRLFEAKKSEEETQKEESKKTEESKEPQEPQEPQDKKETETEEETIREEVKKGTIATQWRHQGSSLLNIDPSSVVNMDKSEVDQVDEHSYSLLMLAVLQAHRDLVFALLEKGANVNYQTPMTGESALHICCGNGNAELVQILLAHGANPHAKDRMGMQPLHAAVLAGGVDAVTMTQIFRDLAGCGATADERDTTSKGYTPLHYLVAIGHSGEYSDAGDEDNVIRKVRMLRKEFNPDLLQTVGDGTERISLHLAAERGHARVINYLLEEMDVQQLGALTSNGDSALHCAARKGRKEAIKVLKQQYSSMWSKPNNEGFTAEDLYLEFLRQKKQRQKEDSKSCLIM